MSAATKNTLHSACAGCGEAISITISEGQRWSEVAWRHVDAQLSALDPHEAAPELRFAIDATCPGCGHPEIGYAPARGEFTCARCRHTQMTRPPA